MVFFSIVAMGGRALAQAHATRLHTAAGRSFAERQLQTVVSKIINRGVHQYMKDVGRVPQTTEGLASLINAPVGVTRWKGPYLDVVWKNYLQKQLVYEQLAPTGYMMKRRFAFSSK